MAEADMAVDKVVAEMADAVNLLTEQIDELIDVRNTLVGAINRVQGHLPKVQRFSTSQWDKAMRRQRHVDG